MRRAPTSSGRRLSLPRAGLFLSLLLACGAALAGSPVKDPNVFELDGNAHDQAPAGDDWELIAPDGTGGNAMAAVFIPDSVTGDDKIFTGGGSKDVRDVSQWGSTTGEPPDKNDIEHAFAAAYNEGGDLVIYFGLDRYSTDGDSAMGFWFFKNTIGITANGFSGVHAVGDILITSDNVNGGAVSVINVFKWVGGQNPLQLLASSTTGGGNTDAAGVFCLNNTYACAVRNSTAQPVPASWGGFSFKGAGSVTSFPQFSFYEGGVNISALLGTSELPCFSSFMAMTRTSASETAQLKDYALGAFPLCGISVGKACLVDADSPKINNDGESIHTKFTVPISNIGAGTVYDVAIEEDTALPGSYATSCHVSSPVVSGNMSTDGAVAVLASLAGGATQNIILECDSKQNPLVNSVTARAKSSAGAASRDLSASHTTGSGETCAVQPDPAITVTKECAPSTGAPTGVKLKAGGGFEVCVNISVKNESVESLQSVSITDNHIGALLTGGSMTPGQTLTYNNQCYTATNADGNETNPAEAAFTDRVDVSGVGAISGEPVGDPALPEATATCKLCPCSGAGCAE